MRSKIAIWLPIVPTVSLKLQKYPDHKTMSTFFDAIPLDSFKHQWQKSVFENYIHLYFLRTFKESHLMRNNLFVFLLEIRYIWTHDYWIDFVHTIANAI